MTNIFKTPEKAATKDRLFEIGLETLRGAGWHIERAVGLGKASVRRITKNGDSKLVSIRTSQDQWVAFPPKPEGKGWITLDEVDVVLAVSVDANTPPQEALVHWLDAGEMRDRFDRAAEARNSAGRRPQKRRGLWIPLYIREDGRTVRFVGGGAGLDHPPIARVPLAGADADEPVQLLRPAPTDKVPDLTISEAKRLLANAFGVSESNIKITIEA